jgi:hypothetical protein
MTNDKAFKNLMKEISPLQLALLRERLVVVMEMTCNGIEDNPEAWNNGIVHPNEYINLASLVDKHLGFDKQ